MASALALAYSIVVLLVAVAGVTFVFLGTDDAYPENNYSKYSVVAAVVLFLVAMIGLMMG